MRATVTIDDHVSVFPMSKQAANSDIYTTSFQSDMFPGRSQLTINIIAEDRAGNETRVARVVFVDNVAPWISLDPACPRFLHRWAPTLNALLLRPGWRRRCQRS